GLARGRLSCRIEPAPALLPRSVSRRRANAPPGGLAALGTREQRRRSCRQFRATQHGRFCPGTRAEILPRHRYRHSDAAFGPVEPILLSRATSIGRTVAADRRDRPRVLARSQAPAVALGTAARRTG